MGHVMLKYTIYSNVMCTTGYSKLPKTNISMLAVCKLFFLEIIVFHLQTKLVKFNVTLDGFGGLEDACWPLVTKFACSNPSDFSGRKNPKHAFLRRGTKAGGRMS
jgi:hypothetical protein